MIAPPAPELPAQQRWRFAHLLLMAFFIVATLLIGLQLLQWVLGISNLEVALDGDVPLTLEFTFGAAVVQSLAFLLPVILVGQVMRVDWRTAVGWHNTTSYWWMMSFWLGLLCIPVTGLIATYTQQLLAYEEIYNPQLDFIVPEGFSWMGLIGMSIAIGLLVPVAEELIFRGVLLKWLLAHVPGWVAIALSSLLFALMHVEPSIVAGTFFLGIACGWVVQQSGSLWPAILIHALNNIVKVILLYLALLFNWPLV